MKLQTRFLLWIVGLLTLVLVSAGAFQVVAERQFLKKELQSHHHALLSRLAKVCEESLYQRNDLPLINHLKTLKSERGFLGAGFLNAKGVFHIHSDPRKIGTLLPDPDTKTRYLSFPVEFSGNQVGNAHLALDQTKLDQFLNASLEKSLKRIGVILLFAFVVGFFGAYVLAQTLVRPIKKVVSGMRRISQGKLDPIPESGRKDELGWMNRELNVTIKKLKEVDEMKRDFVAGVTHDLKSPLKGIQSILTMLLQRLDKYSVDRVRESLLNAQDNGDRLQKLIDDLLTTARIESRRQQFECSLYDVRKSVQEINQLFKGVSQEKQVDLKIHQPNKPTYVWADADRVVQILSNLVSNAFKFTEKGSVTIDVGEEADKVQIRVVDTGTGIPSSDRADVFNKFQRSQSNAKLAQGTGLGLFIVKGLVEGQGGSISVRDNSPQGSIFHFTLPKEER